MLFSPLSCWFPSTRCWFPCVDHASVLISYDVTVRVTSPKITAAFNGRLLETADLHDTLEEVDDDGADTDGNRGNGSKNGVPNTAKSRTRCVLRMCCKYCMYRTAVISRWRFRSHRVQHVPVVPCRQLHVVVVVVFPGARSLDRWVLPWCSPPIASKPAALKMHTVKMHTVTVILKTSAAVCLVNPTWIPNALTFSGLAVPCVALRCLRCTTRYRFSTETLTAARAVGLAVGRFAKWDVPQAPRVKGLVLRASPAGGGGRNGTLKVRTCCCFCCCC